MLTVATHFTLELVTAQGDGRTVLRKLLQMPYALRIGDALYEGDANEGGGFDLTVQSAWFEVQSMQLQVVLDGLSGLSGADYVEALADLRVLGWR